MDAGRGLVIDTTTWEEDIDLQLHYTCLVLFSIEPGIFVGLAKILHFRSSSRSGDRDGSSSSSLQSSPPCAHGNTVS
eukprot:CAMPEP_0172185852 /NCGR_PEP_ID=MMETSP1050-20130122/20407_1 /TAXON_ID=233186 /ORGANISM="Cryptomonas curvata, Strain CCAP979/52" /LENGTH=76 /DNA_ID=CAMNT_0012859899 /DNA_START=262 /DNA_END=492 /DNA_ORIENTATION=+